MPQRYYQNEPTSDGLAFNFIPTKAPGGSITGDSQGPKTPVFQCRACGNIRQDHEETLIGFALLIFPWVPYYLNFFYESSCSSTLLKCAIIVLKNACIKQD